MMFGVREKISCVWFEHVSLLSSNVCLWTKDYSVKEYNKSEDVVEKVQDYGLWVGSTWSNNQAEPYDIA